MKVKHLICITVIFSAIATYGQNLVPYYKAIKEYKGKLLVYNGKWGYMTTAWAEKTKPIYDKVYPIKNGYAKVREGGKYGVVDATGEIVIPCVADELGEIGDGLVVITIENKGHSLVDMEQNIIVPAFRYSKIGNFHEGMGMFKSEGYYGFLNTRGKEEIKAKYDDVRDFHNGYARVEKDDKYGYLDKKRESGDPGGI